jgi:hypothetical protein
MGGNPLISDGKQGPSSLMEIADNLSENFDASVKNSRSPLPHLSGFSRHFERGQSTEDYTTVNCTAELICKVTVIYIF